MKWAMGPAGPMASSDQGLFIFRVSLRKSQGYPGLQYKLDTWRWCTVCQAYRTGSTQQMVRRVRAARQLTSLQPPRRQVTPPRLLLVPVYWT